MIVYGRETIAQAKDEIASLAPVAWSEMAQGPYGGMDYQVNWPLYEKAESSGSAFLVTARRNGDLVGYIGMIVHAHMSTTDTAATSATYYVRPCPQRGLILRRLIASAMNEGRRRGATIAAIRTHPWASCGPILEAMDFLPAEIVYILKLAPPGVSVPHGDGACLTSVSVKRS